MALAKLPWSHNNLLLDKIKDLNIREWYAEKCFENGYFKRGYTNSDDDLLFKIRELYNKIKNNGIRHKFNKVGMYGISICKDNKYEYYVGSELKLTNTKTIIINKGKYAVFEVGNEEEKDIVKVYDFIYNRWLKSTNYEILDKTEIEFYENNNCYLYIPIKDKQN